MYKPDFSLKQFHGLKVVARWSYFLFSFLAIIGSFIHLNIQFEVASCEGDGGPGYDCVGRNLAWLTKHDLSKDINALFWRSVFSLAPDVFVNVWTPFAFAFLAFCQNFHGYKWDLISATWMRCFMFIMFWQLFGVIGYSANWGVFVGLWGILCMGILYIILALLKLWKGDEDEEPVLQIELSLYLYLWFGIGQKPLLHGSKANSFVATTHGGYTDIHGNESSNLTGGGSGGTSGTGNNNQNQTSYQNVGYQPIRESATSQSQQQQQQKRKPSDDNEIQEFTTPDE